MKTISTMFFCKVLQAHYHNYMLSSHAEVFNHHLVLVHFKLG